MDRIHDYRDQALANQARTLEFLLLEGAQTQYGKSFDFAELAKDSDIPVFALGGVAPENLEQAQKHHAYGLAGHSGTFRGNCCHLISLLNLLKNVTHSGNEPFESCT